MRILLFLSVLFCCIAASQAQSFQGHCATTEYLEAQKAADPGLQARLDALEQQVQDYITRHPRTAMPTLVTVPVVFHVVYNTAAQNIPDPVIWQQMQILNADYAKLNSDTVNVPPVWKSIAASTQIQFVLANTDTAGNHTSGIIHTQTSVTSFANSPIDHLINYASQGGANVWDPLHYLNIWVCNLGNGILGYTQMPGAGPASLDGCVVNCIAVGITGATAPYNLGRTVTHEVGHWLDLIHVWGPGSITATGNCSGGSDLVADTPPEDGANFSNYAPYTVMTDACSTSAPGYMWQNYLNYTDDAGMCMFTAGQVQRMQASLYTSRDSIFNSQGFGIETYSASLPVSCYPSPSTGMVNYLLGPTTGMLQISLVNLEGQRVLSEQHLYNGSTGMLDLSGLPNGVYIAEFSSENKHGFQKIVLTKE